MAINYLPCPCAEYQPDPWEECRSPSPCPDPCATEAQRLGKQTQILVCGPVVPPVDPPVVPPVVCSPNFEVGRVAYWDANTVPDIDLYGNRIMVALEGTPTSVAGSKGNAWHLAGASMTAPSDSPIELINSDFVISFRIKIVALPASTSDVLMKLGTLSGWGVRMTSAGAVQFIIGNGSSVLAINASTVPNDAAYHSIIFTFNNSSHELRSHLDGVLTHTVANSQFSVASSSAAVVAGGGSAVPGFSFNLDELAIWHTFWRTDCEVPIYYECLDCDPEEPSCIGNLDNNLIAYWDLDGEDPVDDIGARVLTAGTGASVAAGKIGGAAVFDGTVNGYLTTPDDVALRLMETDFTIRFWLWVDANPNGYSSLLAKGTLVSSVGWGIAVTKPGPTFGLQFVFAGGQTQSSFSISITKSTWVHCVAVYSRATRTLVFYTNATLVFTESSSGFVVGAFSDPLTVGSDPFDRNFYKFYGQLDELLISSYAWTQADVICDYNFGMGRTYPFA